MQDERKGIESDKIKPTELADHCRGAEQKLTAGCTNAVFSGDVFTRKTELH